MHVLVIGSGGREHALVWALDRSPEVERVSSAPGNAGIARQARTVELAVDDLHGLVAHIRQQRYDLVLVGPEAPLVAGLSDRLRDDGIVVFGPSAAAAELEGSKVAAKRFMARHGLPTADFEVFDDARAAREHLRRADYPLVVKADGLAAGKGVVIADRPDTAIRTAGAMLSGELHGAAGRQIVVERCLSGLEASFFVLSDGEHVTDLATCQDYKRVGDDDQGPNTGGMGSYSPSVYLDPATHRTLLERLAEPTIAALRAEGRPYQGVLYIGVMLTADGPQVLEYNARFGDPETQALLPRLNGDWFPLLHACAAGGLARQRPRWRAEASLCVVMSSGGYPGPYDKGQVIEGIAAAEATGAIVFHAGTIDGPDGRVLTAGGRVLGVTALGADLAAARERAYQAVACIRWNGEQHRTDIGRDAVRAQEGGPHG